MSFKIYLCVCMSVQVHMCVKWHPSSEDSHIPSQVVLIR